MLNKDFKSYKNITAVLLLCVLELAMTGDGEKDKDDKKTNRKTWHLFSSWSPSSPSSARSDKRGQAIGSVANGPRRPHTDHNNASLNSTIIQRKEIQGTIIHTEQYYNPQTPRQIQLTIMHPCFWPFLKTKIRTNTLNTKSQVVNWLYTAHDNASEHWPSPKGIFCVCFCTCIYTKKQNMILMVVLLRWTGKFTMITETNTLNWRLLSL